MGARFAHDGKRAGERGQVPALAALIYRSVRWGGKVHLAMLTNTIAITSMGEDQRAPTCYPPTMLHLLPDPHASHQHMLLSQAGGCM